MQFAVAVDEVDDWCAEGADCVVVVVDEVGAADAVGWNEVVKAVVVDVEFVDDLVDAADC